MRCDGGTARGKPSSKRITPHLVRFVVAAICGFQSRSDGTSSKVWRRPTLYPPLISLWFVQPTTTHADHPIICVRYACRPKKRTDIPSGYPAPPSSTRVCRNSQVASSTNTKSNLEQASTVSCVEVRTPESSGSWMSSNCSPRPARLLPPWTPDGIQSNPAPRPLKPSSTFYPHLKKIEKIWTIQYDQMQPGVVAF